MAISVKVPRNDTQPIRVVLLRPGRTPGLVATEQISWRLVGNQKRDQRLKFSRRTRRVEHPTLADLVADCDVVRRY
jgi:hypothetical protein